LKIVQTKFIKREVRLNSGAIPVAVKTFSLKARPFPPQATAQAGRQEMGLSQKTCLMQH